MLNNKNIINRDQTSEIKKKNIIKKFINEKSTIIISDEYKTKFVEFV